MSDRFEKRIARAGLLQEKFPESAKLLEFYRELLGFQKTVNAVDDVKLLAGYFPALLRVIESSGTEPLLRYAHNHLASGEAGEHLLEAFWNRREAASSEAQFFARVVIQPYAESLALRVDVSASGSNLTTCPFCSSKPVASVRRGEGDGARRNLLCSLCYLEWPYRRILCPACGEEDKEKLPVFLAGEIDYVRIEACDTCHIYLKSVDLSKRGFAIPEVDELAAVTLDVWAEENGYSKLETNLLGM